jgi:hypothetical protein
MKIKIKDDIFDSNSEPIMIIFQDDNERKMVIEHLSQMKEKEGLRKYCMFPDAITEENIRNFMEIK